MSRNANDLAAVGTRIRRFIGSKRRPTIAAREAIAHAVAAVEILEGRICLSATAFGGATHYAAGATPGAVATDDFNDDGSPDLVVAHPGGNSVSLLLNDGNGAFGSPHNLTTGAGPVAAVTGDFNSDGESDIATANAGDGTVTFLLGDGTGAFTKVSTAAGSIPGTLTGIAVGDFNGDGNSDVAVTSTTGVYMIASNGDGTFAAPSLVFGGSFAGVAVGDFNADGSDDLAVTDPAGGKVDVALGNGDGTFGTATAFAAGAGAAAIATGDLNGDGVTDIAVTNPGSNSVNVLLGNGAQQSPGSGGGPILIYPPAPTPVPQPSPVGGAPLSATAVAIGVVNGGAVSTGSGSSGTGSSGTGSSGTGSSGGASSGGYLSGDGTFAAPVAISVGAGPSAITTAQLGNGGTDDLIVSNAGSNTVTIVQGGADGRFSSSTVKLGSGPAGVAAADFNGDGGIDLAVSNGAGDGVDVADQLTADVGVSVSAPTTAVINSNLTYAVTVTNSGQGTASNVALIDSLPDGASFVSASTSKGTVDTSGLNAAPTPGVISNVGQNGITVNIGDVAPGETVTITLTVKAKNYGNANNWASVSTSSINSDYSNSYASSATAIVGATGAELAVTQTATPWYAKVGDDLTFDITVTNNGPDTANGVTLTDLLPAGVSLVSATASQGTVNTSTAGQVDVALGDLADGASATIKVTIKSTAVGTLENTVNAAPADPAQDPFPDNNSSTLDTFAYDQNGPFPVNFGGGGVVGPTGTPTPTPTPTGQGGAGLPGGGHANLRISDVKMTDSKTGTTDFVFTVKRTGYLAAATTVKFATANGTAKAGTDYTAESGKLTFKPNVSKLTITVPVKGDPNGDADETFTVKLSNPTNGQIRYGTGTGTIVAVKKPAAAGGAIRINFQPSKDGPTPRYKTDSGLTFGNRGGGYAYGWNSDVSASAVDRHLLADQRYDTFIPLANAGAGGKWEIALANGKYKVRIVAGDAGSIAGNYQINAEGKLIVSGKATAKHHFVEGTSTVNIADGRLTLTSAAAALNNKLDFIVITPVK